jgi:hypothetical protein
LDFQRAFDQLRLARVFDRRKLFSWCIADIRAMRLSFPNYLADTGSIDRMCSFA